MRYGTCSRVQQEELLNEATKAGYTNTTILRKIVEAYSAIISQELKIVTCIKGDP